MSFNAAFLSVFVMPASLFYAPMFYTPVFAADGESHCAAETVDNTPYTICTFSTADDIRLFWGEKETPFGSFTKLSDSLAQDNLSLEFAMNGGMYHQDRSPVGLFVAGGDKKARAQTKASNDNFGMLPNGVFHLSDGQAGVTETLSYLKLKTPQNYATQSGPMLVIDGALHPKFNQNSTSKRVRNGVGVSEDGQEVYFVKSEAPVNFYNFANLFKDRLETPNALYLDGVISRVFDAQSGRHDYGVKMGPIIGVVRVSTEAIQ